ncbi:MAG TPA: class I SAM-dependent methyltransferase [Nitrososphaerales archaeon]|nr:class I SAM-dependent methyltransferase [Nitrososphaerales archaeon]
MSKSFYPRAGVPGDAKRLEFQIDALREEIEDELEILKPTPGMHVLDAGCGTGGFARIIAPRVSPSTVKAVDLERSYISVARRLAKNEGISNVDFSVQDISRLRFPAASFDLTYCRLALPFMPDKLATMKEMKRVTKTGGRIAVSNFAGFFAFPDISEFMKLGRKVATRRAARVMGKPKNRKNSDLLEEELMRRTGLRDVKVLPLHSIATQSDPVKLRRMLLPSIQYVEMDREEILKAGTTLQRYDRIMGQVNTWLKSPRAFWMGLMLLTVGTV